MEEVKKFLEDPSAYAAANPVAAAPAAGGGGGEAKKEEKKATGWGLSGEKWMLGCDLVNLYLSRYQICNWDFSFSDWANMSQPISNPWE